MSIQISSLGFKTDAKLDEFINNKVNKLYGLYDGIKKSEVVLKLDKDENKQNKITEIKLNINGGELFAKKQCKSFEEATDLAIDALKSQLEKHKSRTNPKP